jgi:hypothetical protein
MSTEHATLSIREIMAQPVTFRAFLNEGLLVACRDIEGLTLKYRMTMPDGQEVFDRLNESISKQPEGEHGTGFAVDRVITGIGLCNNEPLRASGRDGDCSVEIGDTDPLSMHIYGFTGVQQLRRLIARTASHIEEREDLQQRPLVVGVTYSEIARLALRGGFRGMEIKEITNDFGYDLQAAHMTFCALNGIQRTFRPAMVYLPTDEFVQKFASLE